MYRHLIWQVIIQTGCAKTSLLTQSIYMSGYSIINKFHFNLNTLQISVVDESFYTCSSKIRLFTVQGRGGLVCRWGKLAFCQLDPLQTKTNQTFYTKYERQHPDCSHKISNVYDFPNRSQSKKKKKNDKKFCWASQHFLFFSQYKTVRVSENPLAKQN